MINETGVVRIHPYDPCFMFLLFIYLLIIFTC